MSAALALVPYDDNPPRNGSISNELFDPGSSCPPTITAENRALVLRDEIKSPHHRTSSHELKLVPFDPTALVPHKTPEYPMRRGFDHCFISVPVKERLSALFATLRRNAERKVIVIFSTWESAKFHSLLFRQLELFSVYELHENMQDVDVLDSHDRFLYTYPGVLFASDICLREFDIPPNVDYILQYEPPMHPTEYIYRFSSAKLFETSCHKALLFVSPERKEMNFVRYFQNAGVKLSELQARKVSQFQPRVEKMILKHTELNEAAWRAFRAYVVAYESHSHKDVWDKRDIDEEAVMKSFANPHFPSFVASHHKDDKIVKELIAKTAKAERASRKEEKHSKDKCEGEERGQGSHAQASWMKGKEKTWRSGQNKSWMTKEKSWKHAHSSGGLNAAAERG
jgi:ATP-dependent RNA helicase DDX18/HAS1